MEVKFICPKCAKFVEPGMNLCPYCGQKLMWGGAHVIQNTPHTIHQEQPTKVIDIESNGKGEKEEKVKGKLDRSSTGYKIAGLIFACLLLTLGGAAIGLHALELVPGMSGFSIIFDFNLMNSVPKLYINFVCFCLLGFYTLVGLLFFLWFITNHYRRRVNPISKARTVWMIIFDMTFLLTVATLTILTSIINFNVFNLGIGAYIITGCAGMMAICVMLCHIFARKMSNSAR